ncbi:acyl-CoA dehydrogenase [Pseudonocardia xishanensis]|uniref:Acyl-CoA dehydrogenase family protein n=1 Tax=Pseudonocardia xishanensis TaxID=630995 RepID=A0ABP8RTQ8_9PSEU
MNFDLDDEQRALAAAGADFFADQAGPTAARQLLDGVGEPAPGRKALAEVGFSAITVPEAAGGGGGTVLDLAVVAEQAGRELAGPSLAGTARAVALLDADDAQLAVLASGTELFAVVDGPEEPVLDALAATRFLAVQDGHLVVGEGEVTAGVPIDATRGLGKVRLRDPRSLREIDPAAWRHARDVGAVVLAAEGLGTAAKAVEAAVEYARTRTAFDRTVGSYQAVKHALVDAWVGVDQLRSLVWWAAWTADREPDGLPAAASAVKAYSAAVVERATETALHVHGGIGFTWEHDSHLYWRRAKVDRLLLGDETEHLLRVADLALAT